MIPRVLGLDVGGTKLLACTLDEGGAIDRTLERPTGADCDPDRLLELIAGAARELSEGGPFQACGLGFPGLVNAERGVARSSVILSGWYDVPLARRMRERLRIPCRIDNDVNNAARAEIRARGASVPDLLFLTIGTGIGGALVLGGRVYGGAGGLAGEIGHVSVARDGPLCVCGRRGCIGPWAAAGGIEDRLGLPRGGLAEAVERGAPEALAALEESAEVLAAGLGNALNLLNLPLVVIGGGMARLGEPYRQAVVAALRREAFPEVLESGRVEYARAGYDAGAWGAALLALEA